MDTTIGKSKDGWAAKTYVELGNRQVLRIDTGSARAGGVSTRASVHEQDVGGILRHRMLRDFSTVVCSDQSCRCTEKIVRSQHAKVLDGIEELKQSALAHYAKAPAESELSAVVEA